MRIFILASLLATVIGVAACGQGAPAGEALPPARADITDRSSPTRSGEEISARARLPEWFDCLRQHGGLVIAAHRGGPASGFPENALETLQANLDQGIIIFEVDVAESADGVQFLMHDDTLERTTTGLGRAAELQWSEIRSATLVDNDGLETDFAPPRLSQALDWAVEAGAVLELDAKRSASYETMINAVRAAGAEDHVILIAHTAGQARALARFAPDMMMTVDATRPADIDALARAGLARENLIAWTGTTQPDPQGFEALRGVGIEPAFGTVGRPGVRLDDVWRADGDLSEYVALAQAGVVLLSSDAPVEVARALDSDDQGIRACGR